MWTGDAGAKEGRAGGVKDKKGEVVWRRSRDGRIQTELQRDSTGKSR